MYLCKVTGTVTSSHKDARFEKSKLLIVHPIDTKGELDGKDDMLALDPRFDAGVGDTVLVAKEGAVAAQVVGDGPTPANVVIVGVVDSWEVE